ncbi:MAG: CinA family protein [Gammaproteobacteria bacterium]|nr:CinA family protein [Gammaproteobacteria bacterium]MBL6999759.1 CinA family protein [Gammaproteobacteria bacterium]
MNKKIEKLTLELSTLLLETRSMISTAESCTGGLIAGTLTDLAGSSEWFERGFVSYSNQSKIDMLGVRADTLQKYGAVSEQVVDEMVKGALRHSLAQLSIGVSGIAGPGGGSENRPVGTVCFGFMLWGECVTETHHFEGDRKQVRLSSLVYALTRLIELIKLQG